MPDAEPAAVPETLARLDAARGAGDNAAGEVATLVPAATVVVLRDGAGGLEVLMLRRHPDLAFAGGMWVFPGGRIDAADFGRAAGHPTDGLPPGVPSDDPGLLLAAARRAAVREAAEEAALDIDVEHLVWCSHWTPPERSGKRFETWFFLTGLVGDHEPRVVVDGSEVVDHRWIRPADALALRNVGELELTPPTWITLWDLLAHDDTAAALQAARAATPRRFATRIAVEGDEVHALYDGDAGYATSDASVAGPRHRLTMRSGPWTYRRDAPAG